MSGKFQYENTLKTKPGYNFLNLQQYLFIGSKTLTKIFFYSKISPHTVILISMLLGVAGSYLMVQSSNFAVIAGAVMLFYKNVLDKVDGSLARAKGLDSRRGRFYDSISDFIVTLASFTVISYSLYIQYDSYFVFIAGFAAMIFSMLQCSYFIFYQLSFIKTSGKQTVNRLIEDVSEVDLIKYDKWTILLQRVFLLIYGWQDKLFYHIDLLLLKRLLNKSNSTFNKSTGEKFVPDSAHNNFLRSIWYSNKPFLTLSSSLSIGTHIFLICISAVIGRFDYYIFVNLIFMNLLLILSVAYHFKSTINKLNS